MGTMPPDPEPADEPNVPGSRGYWYRNDHAAAGNAVDVLRAVRRFRMADLAMRNRARSDLDMNATDLVALRRLIAAGERSEPIGPKDLSLHLGISSAATAKLLSRLESTGRLRREPHPSDRRAQVLYATGSAHQEVRRALGSTHSRMLAAAEKLSPTEQIAVVHFLDELSQAMAEPPEPRDQPDRTEIPDQSGTEVRPAGPPGGTSGPSTAPIGEHRRQ